MMHEKLKKSNAIMVLCLMLMNWSFLSVAETSTETHPATPPTAPEEHDDPAIEEEEEEIAIEPISIPNQPHPSHISEHKHLPVSFLHGVIAPIREKIEQAFHPNFAGVFLVAPHRFWEKIAQHKRELLAGPHAAIFGAADPDRRDYPFAYRKGNFLKDKMADYEERVTFGEGFKYRPEVDPVLYHFPFLGKRLW